ncbi:hypothetical protein DMA15_30240 [Streptomyces sp. WAC 01529]|uniref:hypothetical protein n=1 Tax=Streptomyces sp. WAC 01529 TaxID=2203205 RepID=UPI000F6BF2D7|nr:hypothetical protein [Streptomyces sp. WAC 01529]AZM56343.1 hypothetical protein DMA15_30240 [Streptomyces sp. WAC 01529]
MNSFLSELGKKLADRWASLLALPGALFLTVVACARVLGHDRAWDTGLLETAADRGAVRYEGRPALAVLVALGFLAAATLVGLVVRWSGSAFEACWLTAWHRGPAALLIKRRQKRWEVADAACQQARAERRTAQADRRAEVTQRMDRNTQARNRLALASPERATWMGDRMHGCALRVHNQYGLDLDSVWSRLWITLPDAVRSDIRAARTDYSNACALTVWGALYVLTGAVWWYPALMGGSFLLFLAWWRARRAIATLADLVEAAVDVHSAELATSLGFTLPQSWVTPDIGAALSERLRKGT